jgi:hypothetical protein
MSAPKVRLVRVEGFERPYRLRMPFRFGVKTATHGRQAIVKVRIRLEDGSESDGCSAEALGAKWFDKNLALSDADNHDQLRKALELAGEAYLQSDALSAFGLFADNYDRHVEACSALELNPLIASFGQSLIDRAVLDGLLRALDISFYEGMRANIAGLREHRIIPELDGVSFPDLFAEAAPKNTIDVRHTVGLVDPITAADLAEDARVNDGLPETLEEVVAFYGNRYFKIKVGGNDAEDTDRLVRIASVLDAGGSDYRATLDGNEQYPDAESFAEFFRGLRANDRLKRLLSSLLYVEQPINRKEAFTKSVAAMADLAPVIIDESDGALSAFVTARDLGYSGVSSKACKGIYKSMINHARCRMWNRDEGMARYFMSAEDLTCEPGIAIQQDLALVGLLGLTHVERNAHHFIDGFGDRPRAEASAFLAAHPDLYHEQDGRVRLKITDGQFAIGSLACSGFACAVVPGLEDVRPMPRSRWPRKEAGHA